MRVKITLATYRAVRSWFGGLYNPAELKAVMRFMLTPNSANEAERLARSYARQGKRQP